MGLSYVSLLSTAENVPSESATYILQLSYASLLFIAEDLLHQPRPLYIKLIHNSYGTILCIIELEVLDSRITYPATPTPHGSSSSKYLLIQGAPLTKAAMHGDIGGDRF